MLAEGTGAEWAQVWLLSTTSRSWPRCGRPTRRRDRRSARLEADRRATRAPVVLAGETLGVLRLQERRRHPLTPVEERLFTGLAAQAGPVVHGVQLRTELSNRVVELSRAPRSCGNRASDWSTPTTTSGAGSSATSTTAPSSTWSRLTVNLRLAETIAQVSPERARGVLADQAAATDDAIATLVDLSRGIYPGTLTEAGIGPALRSAASTSPIPVDVATAPTGSVVGRDRGGGLLLLPGGRAERRQARDAEPGRDRDRAPRRSGRLLGRGRRSGVRPGDGRRWPAWPTCATGSTRSGGG